ncbi:hypothetical protein [Thermomonas carbonis]|uniref:Glycosyltransferase family 39 protein n=1 Tax=Thermomonas carbonis TaxID=1463158 RepID=A0A7G9SLJ4_9GAMM|nr:hypothetical protein [Thermomonas carbonis]QNN68719.1 hypothetical protein H9L16_08110 [Thermomonas carbonis]GHC09289.1 hypothetical protein GCM10010080_25540 [Thermomonas carbonis]
MSQQATEVATGPNCRERPEWPTGLLALTLLLSIAAPLAMYSGRVPGLGEFDYQIYYRLLFYNDFTNSLAMLGALLLAFALRPLHRFIEQLADSITNRPITACIAAFSILAIASRVVYQGFPLAMDEYAPLLQARIFASGALTATYPPELMDRMVVPGFQGVFILVNHDTGQAASAYWPGLALLMTPFALFGGEWLLNPLMGAIGLWLIGDLAKQASGSDKAFGWAFLVAMACPQYSINAMSYYAMSALLTLNLLFLWLLLRPGWRQAMLAGVVGSIALVLHNPVPHALFAVPVFIWMLADPERRRRLVPLAAGYLPLTLLLCLGWPLLTSTMGLRLSGVTATHAGFFASWVEKLQGIFFVPNLELLVIRSYAAWKALIWAAPGTLILALIARRQTTIQRLLLAGFLITFGFYFFFPYDQGHGWGYRYVHSAWGLVAVAAGVFAVRGISTSPQRSFLATAICAGLLAMPAFMYSTRQTINTSIAQQPPTPEDGRSVVFFSTDRPALYSVDLVRNYPRNQERTINMLSEGTEADRALMRKIAGEAVLVTIDQRGSSWRIPDSSQAAPPASKSP